MYGGVIHGVLVFGFGVLLFCGLVMPKFNNCFIVVFIQDDILTTH